jgi:hypothetical protein
MVLKVEGLELDVRDISPKAGSSIADLVECSLSGTRSSWWVRLDGCAHSCVSYDACIDAQELVGGQLQKP